MLEFCGVFSDSKVYLCVSLKDDLTYNIISCEASSSLIICCLIINLILIVMLAFFVSFLSSPKLLLFWFSMFQVLCLLILWWWELTVCIKGKTGDNILHSLAGGGYVVSPVEQGKKSAVKHMLAIDWKFWRSYLQPSSARTITIRMLGRLAGNL